MSEIVEDIALPEANLHGETSLETVLRGRRSIRELQPRPLSQDEIAQLLWAAQGITNPLGLRTAPSAGALYPLELYLLAGAGGDLGAGVYKYRVRDHLLSPQEDSDRRAALAEAAWDQNWVRVNGAVFVISGVRHRTTRKYGERGVRYVYMEAGHAAQNLLLQAVALGLAAVPVGAFDDRRVGQILAMPADEQPLYLIAVGWPR